MVFIGTASLQDVNPTNSLFIGTPDIALGECSQKLYSPRMKSIGPWSKSSISCTTRTCWPRKSSERLTLLECQGFKKSFVADEVLLFYGIAKLAIICCVLRVSQIRRARGKRGRSGAEQIMPSNLADSDQVGITRQVLVQKNRP